MVMAPAQAPAYMLAAAIVAAALVQPSAADIPPTPPPPWDAADMWGGPSVEARWAQGAEASLAVGWTAVVALLVRLVATLKERARSAQEGVAISDKELLDTYLGGAEPEPEPSPVAPAERMFEARMCEALSEEDKAKADEARLFPSFMFNEKRLIKVARKGETAEVRVLPAAGTDPDAADMWGVTALHFAAAQGHEEAVGALAEGGADLDKANNLGATPLMVAVQFGRSGVMRKLLELGADHTVVGTGGWCGGKTALEVAEAGGKHAEAAVLQAWAAGTRDAAELDRLVAQALAAQAPADEEDSTDEERCPGFGADDY